MRHLILNIVNQPEATCKFISGDGANISMIVVMELDAEELLEQVLIGAGFARWTNDLPRNDRQAGQNGRVLVMGVQMILYHNLW